MPKRVYIEDSCPNCHSHKYGEYRYDGMEECGNCDWPIVPARSDFETENKDVQNLAMIFVHAYIKELEAQSGYHPSVSIYEVAEEAAKFYLGQNQECEHCWTAAENIGGFFWWCPKCDEKHSVNAEDLNNGTNKPK